MKQMLRIASLLFFATLVTLPFNLALEVNEPYEINGDEDLDPALASLFKACHTIKGSTDHFLRNL